MPTQTTATKAHAAALVTFVSLLLAIFGLGEVPDGAEIEAGIAAFAAAGSQWVITYAVRNKEKQS